MSHGLVAGIWFDDDDAGGRDIFQIGAWQQRAQEQGAEAEAAQQHQQHHHPTDNGRHIDVAFEQSDRQQGLHLKTLDARGNIRLQQRAELCGIEHLALRAAQLDCGKQILAQFRFGMLDDARDLAYVRRVQQRAHTLPPNDKEHSRVGRGTQGPTHAVGKQGNPVVKRGHSDHRDHERGQRGQNPAQQDQPPAAARKRPQLVLDDRIKRGIHGVRLCGAAITTCQSMPTRLRISHSMVSNNTTSPNQPLLSSSGVSLS